MLSTERQETEDVAPDIVMRTNVLLHECLSCSVTVTIRVPLLVPIHPATGH